MSSCYCDYGDVPDVYSAERRKARKAYSCYECAGRIVPGEQYERVSSLFDGIWGVTRTCCRCLDARDYITAHAPCFCWLHGSMLDDARDTLWEYRRESAGFWIGGMKRVLRAERRPTGVAS
ncbi:MAG: hypothetical protein RJA63_3283 [Pseudomonadota bacterium]